MTPTPFPYSIILFSSVVEFNHTNSWSPLTILVIIDIQIHDPNVKVTNVLYFITNTLVAGAAASGRCYTHTHTHNCKSPICHPL